MSTSFIQRPLISVIIPVYNIDKYLASAIDSVANQDIGFRENIELIIVDDGSSDTSRQIAQNYAIDYSYNIVVVTQKNSGVSSARNTGLAKARGEFIHFFDGDDILTKDYYRQSINFLEQNDVDFVASKIKFFDEIINSHPLNYKFDSMRVLDLDQEKQSPLVHVITCVFRREAIADVRFDTELSIAEDMKFISDVARKKRAYGVLKKPTYYYRKRGDGSSAIASSRRNEKYYLPVVRRVYKQMLDDWRQEYDSASPIEYTILYDLSYRLDHASQDVLSVEQEAQYKSELLAVATNCSIEAIAGSKFLSTQQKIYLLKSKYGDNFSEHLEYMDGRVNIDGYNLSNLASGVFLDFLNIVGKDKYRAEGYIENFLDLDDVKYYIDISGVQTELKFIERKQLEKSFLGDVYQPGGAFEVDVDIPKDAVVSFIVKAKDWYRILPIATGPFTRFGALRLTYRRDDNRLLKRKSDRIISSKYSTLQHLYLELRMMLQIVLNWRFGTVRERLKKLSTYNLKQLSAKRKLTEIAKPWFFMAEAIFYIPRGIFLRASYYITKRFKKRPVWIVSDRGMAAGDNGEALFRYVKAQKDCPAEIYFALSKKSKDYERIQSIGSVLDYGSLKYKRKFLLADKIISSHADIEVTNPFLRQIDHFANLLEFDFVFLQHGIIRNDLSSWLNRFDKNIALFVTSAQKEYDSIFDNPYYYPRENILLSGLPRYDYLENRNQKKIIFAPTYRGSLLRLNTNEYGQRAYDGDFKSSEYFHFYKSLINDKRLRECMRGMGISGEFYVHPNFAAQIGDFQGNEEIIIESYPYDYAQAINTGSLLVTDYSSIVFDFAYLKKPVIYAQFDKKAFYAGQPYSEAGFFSDKTEGFGEVYETYETLVDGIIAVIDSNCVMSDKYKNRVDEFFYKVDKNNSRRVYNAIISREQDEQISL